MLNLVPSENDEYLRLCEELREERLILEDWRKYDQGIVLASKLGDRFLQDNDKDGGHFLFFAPGHYKLNRDKKDGRAGRKD